VKAGAITEGIAQALQISIVERRMVGSTVLSSSQRSELFKRGPGDGFDVANFALPLPLATVYVSCDPAIPHRRGFMYPQIMWKLINGRRCESATTCNTPSVVSDSPSVAFEGRRSFTLAMAGNNYSSLRHLPIYWRWWLRLLLNFRGLMNPSLNNQISVIFAEHGL
jgi:hypothetical protein